MAKTGETYVYLIGSPHSIFGNAVKVGLAANPGSRMCGLQTGNAEHLELLFTFRFATRDIALRVERSFHDKFEHARIQGEWFGMGAERALFHLGIVVVNVLSDLYSREHIAQARRYAGLLEAFEITDRASAEQQYRWNDELVELEDAA